MQHSYKPLAQRPLGKVLANHTQGDNASYVSNIRGVVRGLERTLFSKLQIASRFKLCFMLCCGLLHYVSILICEANALASTNWACASANYTKMGSIIKRLVNFFHLQYRSKFSMCVVVLLAIFSSSALFVCLQ